MADGTDDTGEAGRPGRPAGPGKPGRWGRLRAQLRGRAAIGPGAHGAIDPVAREGHLEFDRILFFTDAVFAIAITLLIVDLPVQVERAHGTLNSADQLRKALPGIYGFAISFAVIALFWLAHHSTFRYIKAIDRPLMLLNLLFLGVIAFLPFPTELLSASSSSSGARRGVLRGLCRERRAVRDAGLVLRHARGPGRGPRQSRASGCSCSARPACRWCSASPSPSRSSSRAPRPISGWPSW